MEILRSGGGTVISECALSSGKWPPAWLRTVLTCSSSWTGCQVLESGRREEMFLLKHLAGVVSRLGQTALKVVLVLGSSPRSVGEAELDL